MPNFRKLMVWEKSHRLVLTVYEIIASLPTAERFGLQAQMRRAAVSIAANIAEGSGRATDRDYAWFMSIAIGSANELDYHLELSGDLGYLSDGAQEARELAAEVRAVLQSPRMRLREEN